MNKEEILKIIKDWRTAHPKYRTDERLALFLVKYCEKVREDERKKIAKGFLEGKRCIACGENIKK
jgi:hypothetical protein